MIAETLQGGDIRLQGTAGAFVYRRLRPGVFLTCFRGRDAGEFGTAPLEIIAQEYRLFEKPVEWFFDATQLENATRAVSDEWTVWLRRHRTVLSRMHVLTGDPKTQLRISVARHFSDSMKEMALYTDRGRWERVLVLCVPQASGVPALAGRMDEPALDVVRSQSRVEGLTLGTTSCRWNFRSLDNGIIFTTFTGDDTGDLTDLALAEMQRVVDSGRGKIRWFLDLREARNVSTRVSETWTAWLSAHHDRLAGVTVLSPSPLFPLVLTVAKYRSGAERLFRIHRGIEPFREELVALTSGEVAKAAGV